MELTIRISPGELLDKFSILEIKRANISDPAKNANVLAEIASLDAAVASVRAADPGVAALYEALSEVNAALWAIEDDIRACEAGKDFGPTFVELARSVYVTNDKRAALKKEINLLLDSDLVEEKSYEEY